MTMTQQQRKTTRPKQPDNPATPDVDESQEADDTTTTESDYTEADVTVTTLDEQHRANETPATQQSSVKSHLTDPNYEEQDWANIPGAPDGLVLGPNQNMSVDGEPSADGTHIVLSRAVYRAFLPMGSKRWAFVLEHPASAQIPMSIVRPHAPNAHIPDDKVADLAGSDTITSDTKHVAQQ